MTTGPCKGGALPTELIARAPVILRKSPDGKATGAERIGNDGKREERLGAQIPGVSPNSVSAMFLPTVAALYVQRGGAA